MEDISTREAHVVGEVELKTVSDVYCVVQKLYKAIRQFFMDKYPSITIKDWDHELTESKDLKDCGRWKMCYDVASQAYYALGPQQLGFVLSATLSDTLKMVEMVKKREQVRFPSSPLIDCWSALDQTLSIAACKALRRPALYCHLPAFNNISCQDAFVDTGATDNTISEACARECGLQIDTSCCRQFQLSDDSSCTSIGEVRVPVVFPDGQLVSETFVVLRTTFHKIVLGAKAIHKYASIQKHAIWQECKSKVVHGTLAGLHTLNKMQESALALFKRPNRKARQNRIAQNLKLALDRMDREQQTRRQAWSQGGATELFPGVAEYELARAEMWFKLHHLDPALAQQCTRPT